MRLRDVMLPLLLVLGFAGCAFLTGMTWGLPSREADVHLFGPRTPWSGEQIMALTGDRRDTSRGADVDADAVDRTRPVLLNATDADRAAIVRRYRLYTYQPDEMNTLMALAAMKPGEGDFDPKMYKYGGLWVYPVGALLQGAAKAKLITLRSDLAYYLDHPEQFGRFYLVARGYAVAWGLAGVVAVLVLAWRLTHLLPAAVAAAGGFAVLPVVITQAHEAKPHLPGTVLMLFAVLAAAACVRSGKWRHWLLTGALCGAAVGMVVSTWPVFALLPLAVVLAAGGRGGQVVRMLFAAVTGVAFYCITNPYVVINLFTNRQLLRSHFQNTADFYAPATWLQGLGQGLGLVMEATSPMVLLFGTVALVVAVGTMRRRAAPRGRDGDESGRRERAALPLLIAVPAVLTLGQFLSFAGGQPPDYSRFAMLPAIAILLAAVWLVARFESRSTRALLWLALLMPTVVHASFYLRGFVGDCTGRSTRMLAAALMPVPYWQQTLALTREPAPWSLPPVDLWAWRIVLQPRDPLAAAAPATPDLALRTTHNPYASAWMNHPGHGLVGSAPLTVMTRISHAGKAIEWIETDPGN